MQNGVQKARIAEPHRMAIEAGFANADDILAFEKRDYLIPGSRGRFHDVVGMDTRRGEELGMVTAGQRHRQNARRGRSGDRDDGLDSSSTSASEDGEKIDSELLVVQVCVRIDENSHVRSRSLEIVSKPALPGAADAGA